MTGSMQKASQPTTLFAEDLPPWSLSGDEVVQKLDTHAERGLTSAQVTQRIAQYGLNEIPEPPGDPLWRRYWNQLTGDAVVRLLLIAAVISLILQEWLEGIAILVMLNIMAGFGLWQEGKADDAARSLRKSDEQYKMVIRDGVRSDIRMEQIVPGDVIYLPTGAIAPADGRIIATVNAEKDTSKLTGESLPTGIDLCPLPSHTVINEQRNMVHRGDAIVGGNATYVVTATGSYTEIGKIATTLAETEQNQTPLDDQLESLGNAMASIFKWLAGIVIGFGTMREIYNLTDGLTNISALSFLGVVELLTEAFINAVALIIAAIPEGLPAVLTITLAIATQSMRRKNTLIRKPKAVEGGGSMTVLLTDKTGTLTANQMEVTHCYLNGQIVDAQAVIDRLDPLLPDDAVQRAAMIAALCNNSSSATEVALLRWVEKVGLESLGDIIQIRAVEHGFDQTLKRMSTVHPNQNRDQYHILTKGAPEQILDLCHMVYQRGELIPLDDHEQVAIQAAINELASKGLRVIALAQRAVEDGHTLPRADAETELTFIGLLGIMDPPRDDVTPAIAQLRRAGIRTVMVTGDNPLTAYHVARQVGIIEQDMPLDQAVIKGEELVQLNDPSPAFLTRLHSVRVFARVTPEHKAGIVRAMRTAGFIVGMTGDGVNDAIALKESDVGFAMGNGTDVAREVADAVLMDSRFGTIPSAVEEGRNVIHRIRLYLSYILSGNGCEVGAFIVAYILGIPIPLTALVLLVINFATDSFPALAMSFEPGERDVMEQAPRKREAPFINQVMWIHIGVQTVIATIVIMAVYVALNPHLSEEQLAVARAAAFMTYIFQKLYRAFTARSLTRNIWDIGLFQNRWSIGAVALSFSIALISIYVPGVNTAMGMTGLGLDILLVTALVGLIPPFVEELTKLFLRRTGRSKVTLYDPAQ